MLISLSSCKKEHDKDNDLNTEKDQAISESSFNDAQATIERVMVSNSISGNSLARIGAGIDQDGNFFPCRVVAIDTIVKKIIIDYGSGCTSTDGRNRTKKGQIIVVYTERFRMPGSVLTITFNNYFYNGNKVEGKKVVTNLGGANSSGDYTNMHWSVVVSDSIGNGYATIIHPDGSMGKWKTSRDRKLIQGGTTDDDDDDVYQITGTSNGINRKGIDYTVAVIDALIHNVGCWENGFRFFSGGRAQVNSSAKPATIISFGDGTSCGDDKVYITRNGHTHELK
ncbi:MAG TPA: hypothetical protein VNW99_02960 [Cytophagaceae bacterium]|nr:hypothetical protein [Cytophagaceae bacterium]